MKKLFILICQKFGPIFTCRHKEIVIVACLLCVLNHSECDREIVLVV